METFKNSAMDLMKIKLGISSSVRDALLLAIVSGIVDELTNTKGVLLNVDNPNHLMLVVDLATWRYESKDESGALPPNLRLRMNELMLHDGGGYSAPV